MKRAVYYEKGLYSEWRVEKISYESPPFQRSRRGKVPKDKLVQKDQSIPTIKIDNELNAHGNVSDPRSGKSGGTQSAVALCSDTLTPLPDGGAAVNTSSCAITITPFELGSTKARAYCETGKVTTNTDRSTKASTITNITANKSRCHSVETPKIYENPLIKDFSADWPSSQSNGKYDHSKKITLDHYIRRKKREDDQPVKPRVERVRPNPTVEVTLHATVPTMEPKYWVAAVNRKQKPRGRQLIGINKFNSL